MNKHTAIIISVTVLAFGIVPTKIYAWFPFNTVTPTHTPTPTPTMIIFQKAPGLQINPGLILSTMTPTATLSPTPTSTSTPTPTITVTPTIQSATVTSEVTPLLTPEASGTPTLSASPTGAETKVMGGFSVKEMAYGAIVVALLLAIIVQANWAKIKSWLHRKTS